MERLWAPWRMQYIEKADKTEGCIFCLLPAADSDRENLILYRSERAFIIMNSYPYNNGHLMVAPYKHTADMYDLDDNEMLEIGKLLRFSVRILGAVLHPDGFNLGINLGRTAGAGIADHLHWHVVPRWTGDSNFMPVVADTKVLPDSLDNTYCILRAKIDELGGEQL